MWIIFSQNKKFTFMRHYNDFHQEQFYMITGEARYEKLVQLKNEKISQKSNIHNLFIEKTRLNELSFKISYIWLLNHLSPIVRASL